MVLLLGHPVDNLLELLNFRQLHILEARAELARVIIEHREGYRVCKQQTMEQEVHLLRVKLRLCCLDLIGFA